MRKLLTDAVVIFEDVGDMSGRDFKLVRSNGGIWTKDFRDIYSYLVICKQELAN